MRAQKTFFKSILAKAFTGLLFAAAVSAQNSAPAAKKTQLLLPLGDSMVKINVYEKSDGDGGGDGSPKITFFAPHHNEQTGLKIAREMSAAKGGRLVEVESVDEKGAPARRLQFTLKGKSYSLDPNRIFTENGRGCANFSGETGQAAKSFADALLKIILAPDGSNRLREGEKFLVAVHNNADVDAPGKTEADKEKDLTAHAFVRRGINRAAGGAFPEQTDGVYLSNEEPDADNFIFLSTPALIGFFAEKGFHVVVQKPAARLRSGDCAVDDGSLSVYAGQRDIPYINLEADAAGGGARQRQMFEAVYELAQKNGAAAAQTKSEAATGKTGKK